MSDLNKTLSERGSRYGSFDSHSEITHALKRTLKGVENRLSEPVSDKLALGWELLTDDQREALEMIAHKIGRILNGDPNYQDSWADIAGYAKLVADRLEKMEQDRDKLEARTLGGIIPVDVVRDRFTVGTQNDKPEIRTTSSAANSGKVRGGQRAGAATRARTRG